MTYRLPRSRGTAKDAFLTAQQLPVDGLGGLGRVVILADEGDARALAEQSAGLAGISSVTVADWSAAVDEMEAFPAATLMLEAEGLLDVTLAAALDYLGDSRATYATRIVVAFAPGQVDPVAAALLGTDAQLLCSPTLADRVGALVLARAGSGGRVADSTRVEAARLVAIAQEVARIAEALGGIVARESTGMAAIADQRMAFSVQPETGRSSVTAAQVRGAIRSRRLRDAEFGAGLFEEPAWDMLLDLLAAELEGVRVSVSSLCIAAAVAQTTALRWIAKMIGAGLLVREDDAADRRRAFLMLSERASAGLHRYCAAVQRAGLGIA